MNNILGQIMSGRVIDENEKFYYVQINGITFQLDKNEIKKPFKMGANFSGFTYENKNHKMQITRNAPNIQVDHYDFGTVVNEKTDLGVFVDIGLPNKDIAVSKDELPFDKSQWPQRGDKLMISLRLDNKQRIWGHLADLDIFNTIALPAEHYMMNHNVKGNVFNVHHSGANVLTDHYNLAFVHISEQIRPLHLGEAIHGRVIAVHPDGKMNLSLKPRAYEAINDDSKMILALLQHNTNNTIPYTDKSNADDIKKYLGISKGQFKRAVGHLLKNELVKETDECLILTENGKNTEV